MEHTVEFLKIYYDITQKSNSWHHTGSTGIIQTITHAQLMSSHRPVFSKYPHFTSVPIFYSYTNTHKHLYSSS